MSLCIKRGQTTRLMGCWRVLLTSQQNSLECIVRFYSVIVGIGLTYNYPIGNLFDASLSSQSIDTQKKDMHTR